jgi:hypothetical protein
MKKMMISGCCGQPSPRHYREAEEAEKLPQNPQVSGGVRLLYLGAGRRDFLGSESGLTYVVSGKRRNFVVNPDDAPAMLKKRFVILEP